ncbi:MAG: putative endoglucanase [Cyanobacteria bacterium RYN_339]|nr:putative endoglucanase [Cyanobacteria bacterium RYN_339]
MSRRPPPSKRPPQRGGAHPKGRKKKKKPSALTGQIVGGLTLLVLIGVVAVAGYLVAKRAIPEPKAAATPAPNLKVARPTIEATVENQPPKRPGLALFPEDEVYAPRAKDIAKDTPLDPPVNGLLARGVLTVFADGKFRPNDPMPRAEFLVWLYNAVEAQTAPGPDPFVSPKKGFPAAEATGEEFKDVPADYWAASVLASAKKSGLFESVLDKEFRPDAPLTRQEWAGFAAHVGIAKEAQAKVPAEIDATKLAVALRKLSYTDPTAIKEEYRWPVFAIVSDDKRKAWFSDAFPTPDIPGPWGPSKPMTRGEAATWLGGFYDAVGLGLM